MVIFYCRPTTFDEDSSKLLVTLWGTWNTTYEGMYVLCNTCMCTLVVTVCILYCASTQVNGQFIEWKQLSTLYEKLSCMAVHSHGLSLVPKLKLEHIHLTSYSRMRVDLAVQVSVTVITLLLFVSVLSCA